MTGYAVVDVETAGTTPAKHHRVVEIAVAHLDESGATTSEWSTLINPRRDLGAGHIHRIRARDVRKAPGFEHVAGELADLRSVAGILALPPETVEQELRRAKAVLAPGDRAPSAAPVASRLALQPGDQVVFTGASRRGRDEWHALAAAAGLAPKEGVTKKTRVVVATDPDSLSAKARKARDRGVPVITEDAFEKLMGDMG